MQDASSLTGPHGVDRVAPDDGLRVVIAHDFMETYGGAERVLAEMAQAFPTAPVVAILGRDEVAQRVGVADRFISLLPQHDRLFRHYRLLAPVLPALVDRLKLPDADVVVTSSYAFAHRLRAGEAVRVCYCHSPLRFAWTMTRSYSERWTPARLGRGAFDAFAAAMRSSDRRAAAGVDVYLTQSDYTADQIRRFYGREPEIVGVPVDCKRFHPSYRPPEDYWFFCARLVEPYKKASLMLDAFRRMPDEKLIIAGDGPAAAELRRKAPSNVEFVGHLDDAPLVDALQRCKGVVFPSCDDFGLVPVEAMACGRPVLAYGEGGALQTVRAGLTGEFFGEQTPEAVVDAVRSFDPGRFDATLLRAHALYWDSAAFRERLRDSVLRAAGLSTSTSTPIDTSTPPTPLPSAATHTGRFDRTPQAVDEAEQVA